MDKNAVQKLIDVNKCTRFVRSICRQKCRLENFVLVNVDGVVGYGYGQGFVLSSRVWAGIGICTRAVL